MVKKQSAWIKHLMSVYQDLKSKNPNIRLKDAMPIAKRSYKK